jgi:3',5'-nucleoside bisphosphate phosphatase
MIDLHSHTTASDGQHAPDELVRLATEAGVTCLAVTDHDTVDGLARARAAASGRGLEIVHGIELSVFLFRREVHVLGHFVDPTFADLQSFSARLRVERESRMRQMVEKMRGLGYPVSMEDVLAIAGDAHLARPHLARALVEKRFCLDTKEAFDRFLGDGKPGWVPRFKLTAEEGIQLIRAAGGAATLAHPFVSKVERHEVQQLKDAGLAGLEVHHSDHPAPVREKLLGWAKALDLVPTAGSDFHGEKVNPGRHLGTASMDPADFDALRRRAVA